MAKRPPVVVDDAGSLGQGLRLTGDEWQDAGAVFGAVIRQLGTQDVGHGGHEVIHADDVIAAATGRGFAGPADDEWHAVSTFVDLCFVPFEVVVQVDAMFFEFLEVSGVCGAVVGAENDECIVCSAGLIQGGHDVADHGVGLDNEVGVVADAAFATEFLTGGDGSVG